MRIFPLGPGGDGIVAVACIDYTGRGSPFFIVAATAQI